MKSGWSGRAVVASTVAVFAVSTLGACSALEDIVSPPPPSTVTTTATATTTETYTSAVTSTVTRSPRPTQDATTTRTTTAAPTTTTQAPRQSAPSHPSPPYAAGSGFEWAAYGPYGTGTSSNCEQVRYSWPADTTECYQMSDGWYFLGIRQAAR